MYLIKSKYGSVMIPSDEIDTWFMILTGDMYQESKQGLPIEIDCTVEIEEIDED